MIRMVKEVIATLICSLTKYTFFSKVCFVFSYFLLHKQKTILGVSVVIVLGGANSGQTSIKCSDLACDVELRPLKICKDLTVKLEVKHLFPTSS